MSLQRTSPSAQGSVITTVRFTEASAPCLSTTAKTTGKKVPGSAAVLIPQPCKQRQAGRGVQQPVALVKDARHTGMGNK